MFYGRAKRVLIMQCGAISFFVSVFLAATWVIHLTEFGMYTAIIPLVLRVSDNVAHALAIRLLRYPLPLLRGL